MRSAQIFIIPRDNIFFDICFRTPQVCRVVLFAVAANSHDICSCCDLWQPRRSFAGRKFPRIRKCDGWAEHAVQCNAVGRNRALCDDYLL
jgi:hypothetical protein